jgi:hypothetical protein
MILRLKIIVVSYVMNVFTQILKVSIYAINAKKDKLFTIISIVLIALFNVNIVIILQ